MDKKKSEPVPGELEKRLIKVKAVLEAAETVMLWLAEGLVFIHLAIVVKVGPSLLIRQNLCAKENERHKWEDCAINVLMTASEDHDPESVRDWVGHIENILNVS